MHTVLSRAFVGLLLVGSGLLSAYRLIDDEFVKQLIERFQAYHQHRPVEKVYVQTDRDAYAIGETIWMKGYLVEGGGVQQVDTVSQVLYVDLVDPVARRVRLRTQLRVTAGYAPGQLSLPDSVAPGTYRLRAYTNYMRNDSEAYYFSKTLTIVKSDGTALPASPATTGRADVQFLPEGGWLVEGIEGRVAFRAVDPQGRGLPVRGFVLDAQKDTVVGFAATHNGMGSFTFKPEAGKTYAAYTFVDAGAAVAYPMPKPQAQGVTMQVDNLTSPDRVRVYVRHNKPTTDAAAHLTLVAQTRGLLIQAARIPMAKNSASVVLPKAEFPEGIAQLTLFDETNRPVCERLIFVNHDQVFKANVTTSKAVYKNRERVDLQINTTDAKGAPVAANVSLAAVDSRLAPLVDSNAANITSHLLLSSDLTGTIEQPGYYFDPTHLDRWPKLDLLLMTQGWRRFAWADVLAGNIPPINYVAERGLSLTGRVLRPNQQAIGSPVALTFLLVRRDSTQEILSGETDEKGNFGAYGLDFTDTTTVLIQGVKGKANRNLSITLDQLLTPTVTLTQVPYNPFEFRRDELAEFERRNREYLDIERQIRRNREVLLESVTVRARKTQAPDSRKIYGTPDASVKFDAMNTAGRMTILDVIQGRVAGVQVIGNGFNARVQIRGATSFSGPVEPLFVIDGMPTDLQGAMSLSVQDVDQVDILKGASAAIYGSRAGGGVISILTKRGSPNYDFMKDVPPGSLLAKLPGYAPVREFYAPRYDQKQPGRDDRLPDYRATLYWNPTIQTNAQGQASVSFFTSDSRTPIRIEVEGITANGQPGRGNATIRVE